MTFTSAAHFKAGMPEARLTKFSLRVGSKTRSLHVINWQRKFHLDAAVEPPASDCTQSAGLLVFVTNRLLLWRSVRGGRGTFSGTPEVRVANDGIIITVMTLGSPDGHGAMGTL